MAAIGFRKKKKQVLRVEWPVAGSCWELVTILLEAKTWTTLGRRVSWFHGMRQTPKDRSLPKKVR